MTKKERSTDTNNWKIQNNKILLGLAGWASAYVITMALAAYGPQFLWESNRILTIIAILLNLGTGTGMILANIRHLEMLDEMMQRIQLEAFGIALGVGVIGGLSYSLLDTENLIPFDAEIGHLIILIGITYIIAVLTGCRRYQ